MVVHPKSNPKSTSATNIELLIINHFKIHIFFLDKQNDFDEKIAEIVCSIGSDSSTVFTTNQSSACQQPGLYHDIDILRMSMNQNEGNFYR